MPTVSLNALRNDCMPAAANALEERAAVLEAEADYRLDGVSFTLNEASSLLRAVRSRAASTLPVILSGAAEGRGVEES